MLAQLINKDQELLVLLNQLGSEQWDYFWLILTHKYTTAVVYFVLLFVIYRKMGWKKMLTVLLLGVLLITISDQLANLFKYGFERLRPCRDPKVNTLLRFKSHCSRGFSFFSAHASTGMGLALYFGLVLRPLFRYSLYLIIPFGLVVGYSRIYLGVHYPLDVLTGFFAGFIIAILMYIVLKKVFNKFS